MDRPGRGYAFQCDRGGETQATLAPACAPAIAQDGTIYFGSQDMNLYALDPSGHKKWSYRTGGPIYSAPTLDATGVVIFGAYQGILTALDPVDGSVDWTKAVSAGLYSPPLIDRNGSIYTHSTDYVITQFVGPTPEPSSMLTFGSLLAALGGMSLGRRTVKNAKRRGA